MLVVHRVNYLPTSREASCFTEPTCPAPEGHTEAMLSTGFDSRARCDQSYTTL